MKRRLLGASMTFRWRVTLAAGASVLLAVASASVVTYFLVRADLRTQMDQSLLAGGDRQAQEQLVHRIGVRESSDEPVLRMTEDLDGEMPSAGTIVLRVVGDNWVQIVRDGQIEASYGNGELPLAPEVHALAQAGEGDHFYDTSVNGTPVRVRAVALEDAVLLIGRGLGELQETLRQLAFRLSLITAFGVVVAMGIGRAVAATAVRPVHRLSDAAEMIARTGDLSHQITESGRDELGRLARSFNTMLDALEASVTRQRQLVADASHELRTPLASLRTNVEVLRRADELTSSEREQLRRDVEVQLTELSRLVENLVELARGDLDRESTDETFDLGRVVSEVAGQMGRQHPLSDIRVSGAGSQLHGSEAGVRRAVANLLDNAVKWSPPEEPIEVEVGPAGVTVTDRGPGIDPEDLPHIFDRFYRSKRARGMPGSGLGLAIVKQVAESHNGTVLASNLPGGGARFELHMETTAGDAPKVQRPE
jgi:two-component system, OmpR family, sensor histidine kinase MprB